MQMESLLSRQRVLIAPDPIPEGILVMNAEDVLIMMRKSMGCVPAAIENR